MTTKIYERIARNNNNNKNSTNRTNSKNKTDKEKLDVKEAVRE